MGTLRDKPPLISLNYQPRPEPYRPIGEWFKGMEDLGQGILIGASSFQGVMSGAAQITSCRAPSSNRKENGSYYRISGFNRIMEKTKENTSKGLGFRVQGLRDPNIDPQIRQSLSLGPHVTMVPLSLGTLNPEP